MKPLSGVVGEDGVEVQSVEAVAVASDGAIPHLGRPIINLHVYEFSWSPDSHRLAIVAAAPPGENNWWVAKLYVVGWEWSGDSAHVTTSEILDPQGVGGRLHGLQLAVPRFSPDGRQIAFIGGLMSDQGSTGGDIYVIPSTGLKTGDEPKDVTPNRRASPAYIAWLDDHDIGISEHVGGSSHITALDLNTGRDIRVWTLRCRRRSSRAPT